MNIEITGILKTTTMKSITRFIVSLITCIMITCAYTEAQDYHTGIGFRAGGLSSGLTIKHFTQPDVALEGILGFAFRSFIITGLYEKHNQINNARGLKWLYGGGAHIGFFKYGGYYYRIYGHGNHVYYVDEVGESAVVGGVDFILGLDYKFDNAPINLGLDIKPFVDFVDGLNGYFEGAISFRFAF